MQLIGVLVPPFVVLDTTNFAWLMLAQLGPALIVLASGIFCRSFLE